MSAFMVAIGGKADMSWCAAHVCFWPKAGFACRERRADGTPRKHADPTGHKLTL